MKSKYVILSLLTLAFLSSSMPSANSLQMGEEAPSSLYQLKQLYPEQLDGKSIVINFWDPADPQSRIRNTQLANFVSESGDSNLKVVSICTSSDKKLADEILKQDFKEDCEVICISKDEIHKKFLSDFQVNSGNRSFLIDANGVLRNISPSLQEINLLAKN